MVMIRERNGECDERRVGEIGKAADTWRETG